MKAASEIILESIQCRQAARHIYPQDPNGLFNTCWLKIRERELKDPTWSPDNAKFYFLSTMRNKARDWQKSKLIFVPEVRDSINTQHDEPNTYMKFLNHWLNEDSDDFYKNILILALRCETVNDVVKLTSMSRATFLKYKALAKKQLKHDFNNANLDELFGDHLL